MSSSTHEDLMLNVENFGPIAEAQNVLIKPMTVFVGASNTGKSYLSTLLYAISRGLDHVYDRFPLERYFEHFPTIRSGFRDMPFAPSITPPDVLHHRQEDVLRYDWDQSSDEVKRIVKSIHMEWLAFASNSISSSITGFFDINRIDDLVTQPSHPHTQAFFNLCQHHGFFDWNIACKDGKPETNSRATHIYLRESVAMILATETDERDTELNRFSMFQLFDAVATSFGAQFHSLYHMTYFPAARSGIIASHRTLNRNLIASVSRSGLDREAVVPYNRIVNDFLENLLRIDPQNRNSDDLAAQLAEIIENSLMNGTVRARDSEYGPPEFVYSQNDLNIPLARSSSMVTELAPIILFLKHFLRVGHFLIIEEPEAHLHPAAQQKFAAALALLVRNGFRVLITTHSHYMVEQISDFVAASNLSPEKRRELLRLGPVLEEQDIYLNEDEVGVYSFDNSSGSTFVKNIPFDESFAYAPPDHIQALTEQFNRNVGIMRAQRNGHSVNGHDVH